MKYISLIYTALLFAASTGAYSADAQPIVTVDQCRNLAAKDKPFILMINENEKLISSIKQCAKEAKIKSAIIGGVGLIKEAELGYLNSETGNMEWQTFADTYELVSLPGNLAQIPNRDFDNIHAVLGNNKFETISGHIKEATVAARSEVMITPIKK